MSVVLNELVDAPFQWFGFFDVLGPLSTAIRVPVAECIEVEVLRLAIDIYDDIHVVCGDGIDIFSHISVPIYIHPRWQFCVGADNVRICPKN